MRIREICETFKIPCKVLSSFLFLRISLFDSPRTLWPFPHKLGVAKLKGKDF